MDVTVLGIQIALVIGLNEAIKRSLMEERHYRYIPLLALVLGVGMAFISRQTETLAQTITNGLIIGLSSVGLFSAVKNTKIR
jgi:hypothetical protein